MKTQILNPAKVAGTPCISIREQLLSSRAVMALASFMSSVLEEKISPVQSLCILNVSLSFTMLLLLSACGMLVLCLAGVWFAAAVYQCLNSGISLDDE